MNSQNINMCKQKLDKNVLAYQLELSVSVLPHDNSGDDR